MIRLAVSAVKDEAVGFTLANSSPALLQLRIHGVMTVADQCALQNKAKALMAEGHRPGLLIVLQDFEGWEKDSRWGDMTFLQEYGDAIPRMVIGGPERWRDQALMFVAKGLRATEIEYFVPADMGRANEWVTGYGSTVIYT